MIPAQSMGGGGCFAFPDVCKTPTPAGTPPLPYPNLGQNTQIKGNTAAKKVFIKKKKAAVVGSEIASTTGDEPGSAGGVISGKTKGTATYMTGYPKVKIEGKIAGMLGSVMKQNDNNIVGAQVAPSQTTVLYSPVPVMGGSASVDGKVETVVEKLRATSQESVEFGDVTVEILDDAGAPLPSQPVRITLPTGQVVMARTDSDGLVQLTDIEKGNGPVEYELVDLDDDALE
ncbi:MAG: DUF4150 domain-containing protein [Planctomycetota bacterium]|jgi:hypothetical protein|nr:DUF4150 domain-containing protein [Planctomycetota bacterium]